MTTDVAADGSAPIQQFPTERADPNSIYEIAKNSPRASYQDIAAVDERDVDAALGGYVPGGSRVHCWLPAVDGHTIHQTARDVMRSAIAAVDKRRSLASQAAQPAEADGAYPQDIGRRHLGERRSDGERLCDHGHPVPAGHPLYWPERLGEYPDDVDPLCLEHAIDEAVSDNGWCETCTSNDIAVTPKASTSTAGEVSGTFACPICGRDTPHSHDAATVREWRRFDAKRSAMLATPPAPNDDLRAAVEAVIALDTRDPNDLRQSDITRGFASGVRRCATILRAALKENRRG